MVFRVFTLIYLSPDDMRVASSIALKAFGQFLAHGDPCLLRNCGKLVVYASSYASAGKRLKSVNSAAEKMAKMLSLDLEVVTFRERVAPIYVYYKNGDEEPIPIYCDKGEKSSIEEICRILKNMMFVLSFHPKHSALKKIRKEIMQFS